ncbi:dnaJ homolog subfamily C member 28 [Syngnathoides biaculeatus]|uniref:dnaJ homolog subfamily C member 28 n=1 Tax=Syngnathoides biaculeatus TaxID=300417 RepID=UPI002ADDFCA6|nr:dnaJ homolog subfamily C member 28 [Syngnathoides biaculeatus]XP_061674781.1 dnaJ homolog subfamily C member 28 [Syngnathoides biaculeatus]XP_061674782.1 dnaJ homolog subfamily C member 28 [Syngnathoides biaculeatus]XP_061674783.1 dnaJ homolog subfamily C member 28 [Syngnathoides biaculeatus]XP_061674784.1 dnaJ homolog subfamily C member 28 [Syngnathoides biaculeatus]XP_061674785.1 dnaJ homolog subfamily C member 28 [Syngnathoides biaculeatus]XP_061674786.1 dnaJ homolog subfamily C member 
MSSHLLVSCNFSHHGSFLLLRSGRSCWLRTLSSRPQLSNNLRESYRLLQLPEGDTISPEQAKESYLRLAKLYHPDSGAPTADAALFARVEEAYRSVLVHRSEARREDATQDEVEDPSSGVAPQHRHYLSYEGVGSGTPSQRERQYRHFRADRAAEQVLNYRQRSHERAAAADGALIERDVRQRSRSIKITQAVERLVEDLIQESMARGDFRNLSGTGKPLNKFEHNPYADPMTHNLNRILMDNGYQPSWVIRQRDIREAAARIRGELLDGRAGLGEPLGVTERLRWEELRTRAGEELAKLNKMVDSYNLIVPMLQMQMVHFSLTREVRRAEAAAGQRRLEQRRMRKEERKRVNAANVAVRSADCAVILLRQGCRRELFSVLLISNIAAFCWTLQ